MASPAGVRMAPCTRPTSAPGATISHHGGRARHQPFRGEGTGALRSFCRRCGTPLIYERTRSPHMINIPRALFQSRTGRHLPHRHRRDAGLGLRRRAAGSAQRLSPRVLEAIQEEKSRTGGHLGINRVALFIATFLPNALFTEVHDASTAPAIAFSRRAKVDMACSTVT